MEVGKNDKGAASGAARGGRPADAEAQTDSSISRGAALQVYLQEYDKIWDEVSARFESQRQAFNYVLIVAGAVITAYSAGRGNPYIYLLAPLLITSLGYIFFDNELMIWGIVYYTRNHLQKRIRAITGDDEVLALENHRFAYMPSGGRKAHQFVSFGRWLVFIMPSLVMIISALQSPRWRWDTALWALLALDVAALMSLLVVMGIAAHRQSLWTARAGTV
jgi:hypothetical protein